MIQIYSSNSYEFLQRILLETVRAERAQKEGLAAVFDRTRIITPNAAVKDEITRAFADDTGIASGLEMVYLGHWLDPRTGEVLGKSSSGTELEWLVWQLLENQAFLNRPACRRLKAYTAERSAAERTQLARRIANLFTSYVSYRLDWVLDWMREGALDTDAVLSAGSPRRNHEAEVLAQHPDALWQKEMWNIIAQGLQEDKIPAWSGAAGVQRIPERFAQAMRASQDGTHSLHVFIPDSMPPLALPFLMAEARRNDVTVYLMNPSKALWFESGANFGVENLAWRGDMASDQGFVWFRKNAAACRALVERVWSFAGEAQPTVSVFEVDCESDQGGVERPSDLTGETLEKVAQLDVTRLLELRAQNAQDAVSVYRDPVAGMENPTLLMRLQKAVLEDDEHFLRPPEGQDTSDDRSLTILKGPTALREVEAVFDWIQYLLATHKGLRADDILVVTPDIDAYAPVIVAAQKSREGVPVALRIAGETQYTADDFAQAVVATGSFLFSRATRESFVELLSFTSVLESRFDGKLDLMQVQQWLTSAGYRWGLDEAHARACVASGLAMAEDARSAPGNAGADIQAGALSEGVVAEGNADPEPFEGTLARALERLVLGSYSDTEHTDPVGDVLPMTGIEVDGWESDAVTQCPPQIDALVLFAALLREASSQVPEDGRNTTEGWCLWTRTWINRIFTKALKSTPMNDFKDRLKHLESTAMNVLKARRIPFEVFWNALTSMLKETRSMTRATGCVTFAGMDDFRRIPYKAVAMIGMDEGRAFPGRQKSEEFDLMNAEAPINGKIRNVHRRGDGDSRLSNRNIFLDLLLAARECVLISYAVGTKHIEATPSVVVQELKRLLARNLADESDPTGEAAVARLTVKLPMSAYRPDNFRASQGPVQSCNASAHRAYAAGHAVDFLAPRPLFVDAPVLQERGEAHRCLTVVALAKILKNPSHWLEKQIRLTSPAGDDAPEVPLSIDANKGLTGWRVKDMCTQAVRSGLSDREILARARNNPSLCARALRGMTVAPVLHQVRALEEAYAQVTGQASGTETVPAGVMTFAGPDFRYFDELGVPSLQAHIGLGERPTFVVIPTSAPHCARLFLQFAAHAALGHEVDFLLLSWQDEVGVRLERWTSQVDLEDVAGTLREVLRQWLIAANCHSGQGPYLWTKDADTYSLILSEEPLRKALEDAHTPLRKAYEAFEKAFVAQVSMPQAEGGEKTGKSTGRGKNTGGRNNPKTSPKEAAARLMAAFCDWHEEVGNALKEASDAVTQEIGRQE